MKKFAPAVAGLALAALMTASSTTAAKADGGAIAIGVGAYLLVDAIVGRTCQRHEWPFNLVVKLADELHGRPGCYRDGDEPHHHHHHKHYK